MVHVSDIEKNMSVSDPICLLFFVIYGHLFSRFFVFIIFVVYRPRRLRVAGLIKIWAGMQFVT